MFSPIGWARLVNRFPAWAQAQPALPATFGRYAPADTCRAPENSLRRGFLCPAREAFKRLGLPDPAQDEGRMPSVAGRLLQPAFPSATQETL